MEMDSDRGAREILALIKHPVGLDDTVWLSHATTKTKAVEGIATGRMRASIDGWVYLATHPSIVGRIMSTVDGVVDVRVAISDLLVVRGPADLSDDVDGVEQAEFKVWPGTEGTYEPAEVGAFTEYGAARLRLIERGRVAWL